MLSVVKLADLFHLYLGLEGKDKIKYKLIHRYWNKVSVKLKDQIPEIEDRAIKRADEIIEEAMLAPFNLFNLVQNDSDIWSGGVVKFPLGDKE